LKAITKYGEAGNGRVSTTTGVHIGAIVQAFRTLDIMLSVARVRSMEIEPSPGGLTIELDLSGHLRTVSNGT
jgi:hypothetical protein